MEEAQNLAQSAQQPHHVDRLSWFALQVLNDETEIQCPQRVAQPADDIRVGIGNAQDPGAVAPFCVEHP